MPQRSGDPVELFVKAIRTALIIPPGRSQRDLCTDLGCTIGSLSKYLRGEVHPTKVGFEIQAKLAGVLGHSIDELHRYYETGEWTSDLTLDDVTGWLQSTAGTEDFPAIMQSLAAASARMGKPPAEPIAVKPEPYTWPMEALQEAGITDKLRERMGLGNEVLKELTLNGAFDDELVEAFSVATNLDEGEVRQAFTDRVPIT